MGWFSFLKQAAADVPTPSTGKTAIFVDATSGQPSYKGDDGVSHSLVGTSGVASLNARTGDISLAAGTNMAIVESPTGTFTFNSSGGGGTGTALPWFFFEDYGGDPTGVTDSTAAVQGAINAAAAAGGGVCGSKQANATFLIAGALQDTSRGNAQIIMPPVHAVNDPSIAIGISGYLPPSPVFSVIGSTPNATSGLHFKSTLSAGTGAVFGGWGPSGSFGNFTNVTLDMQGVTIETVPNPTITGLDASHIACLNVRNVVIFTGNYSVADMTAPTTATSFGLRTPRNGNGAYTAVNDCTVGGFYNAYEISEHATGDNLNLFGCNNGLVYTSADHSSHFGRVDSVHAKVPVKGPSSGTHYTTIEQLNIEHAASGTFTYTAGVSDSANGLLGNLRWHTVLAGTPGSSSNFPQTGAQNLQTVEVGNPPGIRTITTTDIATLRDNNGVISYTGSSAVNVTIPPESSVPWKVGTLLTWLQTGTGQITVVAGSGVTIVPATPKTRTQYSFVSALKTGTNTWTIFGDLA